MLLVVAGLCCLLVAFRVWGPLAGTVLLLLLLAVLAHLAAAALGARLHTRRREETGGVDRPGLADPCAGAGPGGTGVAEPGGAERD